MLRSVRRHPRIALAVVVALAGLGTLGKVTQGHASGRAYSAVSVVYLGRVYCWPVAVSGAAQRRGLSGLSFAPYPLVYEYPQPRVASFWMAGTRLQLTGVWVDGSGRVSGHWVGVPGSHRTVSSPGVVSAVVEFPHGWPVPHTGSVLRTLGSCDPVGAL